MFRLFIIILLLTLPGAAHADDDLRQALADPAALPELTPGAKAELDGFYAKRDYRPAWNLSDDEAIKKTLAFLDSVDALVTYHGLAKSSYRLDDMRKLADSTSDDDRQRLEFLISESLLHLAHDLHGDAVNLDALYTGWNFHRRPQDLTAQLSAALNDGKLEAFFDRLAPQTADYRNLAKALQDYRAMGEKGAWPAITLGPSLKPVKDGGAAHDPRVAQLRARLEAEGYKMAATPAEGADVFDEALGKTLIAYQINNGLSPDGHAGAKTQEALNTPLAARIAQIRANMERWRHMPEDYPPRRYVLINIPDFSIAIFENGHEIYRGTVIDGMPNRQTPFIDSRVVNVVFNPSWHVPVDIARKDILPKLRKDPHYLEKLGIVIAGRKDDPSGTEIDWQDMDDRAFNYQLRQVPGDLNSLGKLKFNFANPFDVYMHGTPHQELFDKAERDFSSGCVRLEDPVRVGEILLQNNKDKGGWSEERIEQEIDAADTHWVTLSKPMPINILYWSVFTAEDGRVNFRKDIYGYDSLLMQKLKNSVD